MSPFHTSAFELLAAMWDDFHKECLPKDSDENQLRYAEMLFFSGMMSMLLHLEKYGQKGTRNQINRLIAELDNKLVKEDDK